MPTGKALTLMTRPEWDNPAMRPRISGGRIVRTSPLFLHVRSCEKIAALRFRLAALGRTQLGRQSRWSRLLQVPVVVTICSQDQDRIFVFSFLEALKGARECVKLLVSAVSVAVNFGRSRVPFA